MMCPSSLPTNTLCIYLPHQSPHALLSHLVITNILQSRNTSPFLHPNTFLSTLFSKIPQAALHQPAKNSGALTILCPIVGLHGFVDKVCLSKIDVHSLPRQAICCQLCVASVRCLNHIPFFNTFQRKWNPHFREGMCSLLLRTSRKKNELLTLNSNSTEGPRMEPTKDRHCPETAAG